MPRPQRFFLFKIESIFREITDIEMFWGVSYEKCLVIEITLKISTGKTTKNSFASQ